MNEQHGQMCMRAPKEAIHTREVAEVASPEKRNDFTAGALLSLDGSIHLQEMTHVTSVNS